MSLVNLVPWFQNRAGGFLPHYVVDVGLASGHLGMLSVVDAGLLYGHFL
jgi:hypothetical protein